MRVLETKVATTGLIMGKKKHRIRKQNRENSLFPSDSSDDAHASEIICKHVGKAVNFNVVKKTIKQQNTFGICKSCEHEVNNDMNHHTSDGITHDDESINKATPSEDEEDMTPTVWLCLQCAHQGCDRNSSTQHALKHYETPHSVSHSLAINTETWVIWCYDCENEVPVSKKHNLKTLAEFLRKHADQESSLPSKSIHHQLGGDSIHQHSKETTSVIDVLQKFDKINIFNKSKSTSAIPKVKGLSNLGNTCFFNAVMQIMSQTSVLEVVLSEQSKKGFNLSLANKHHSDSEPCCSDSSCEEMELLEYQCNPLTIVLPESGALTQSLLTFLREMNSTSKNNTISPSSLFRQICNKAPRFKGFHEQDSHELLRHLLDGMKAEEIKRSKCGILKSFNLSENTNPKHVEDDTKCKIKVYGRQTKHTFVDSIFGGYFISTVLCEECHHPSQIFEPFQDISLSITEEKPVRPNNIIPGRRNEDKHSVGESAQENEKISKYQQKTSKRLAKRDSKKRLRAANNNKICALEEDGAKTNSTDELSVKSHTRDVGRGSDWDSKSDADIEDNLESDASRSRLTDNSNSVNASTLGRAPISDINETDKISMGSASTNSLDITNMKDINDRPADVRSTHHIDDRKDSGIDSVADSLSTLSLTGQDGTKSNGSSWGGGGSSSSSSTGVIAGSDECMAEHTGSVMATSTVSAETDEGVSVPIYERYDDAKKQAMATLSSKKHAVFHECSVASCLNQFTAPELLTGNNKFGCVKCAAKKYGKQNKEDKKKVYANANKQVLVFSPPAVLTLHLKRFQQVGMSLRKVNRQVDFPPVLDLAPYCSALSQRVDSGQTHVLYSLYGVVEHSGRLSSGHYTAYVKARHQPANGDDKLLSFLQTYSLPHALRLHDLYEQQCKQLADSADQSQRTVPTTAAGKWFHISDSNVSETSEASVLRCQAYMLFYERIL